MSMRETMSQPDFRKPNCLVIGLRSSQTKMLYLSYNTILLIQGVAVYLATVYFIKPELICSPGRSQDDFEDQGTGNILWLRKKDGTFLKAPLEMDAADEGVSICYTFFVNQYVCTYLPLYFKNGNICEGFASEQSLENIFIVYKCLK